MTQHDTLAWTRIRMLAYYGPLHDLTHTEPVSEHSIRSVAESRKKEIGRPNTWHWKVVDTDLPPSDDDPKDNDGRTIAVAVWTACNTTAMEEEKEVKNEAMDSERLGMGTHVKPFIPPELRLDVLAAVLEPLRVAQEEIMGKEMPYLTLETLVAHPDHHRRGAGRILLDWGVRKAEEQNWQMYLSATPIGFKSYERVGFKTVKEITFDRGDWGGEGVDWFACMIRDAKLK